MKNLTSIILLSCISAQEIDSSYSLKWHNEPWGAGGLFPAGPPWRYCFFFVIILLVIACEVQCVGMFIK